MCCFVAGVCCSSFLVRPQWHVAQPVAMSLSDADICSSLLIEAALTDSCQLQVFAILQRRWYLLTAVSSSNAKVCRVCAPGGEAKGHTLT